MNGFTYYLFIFFNNLAISEIFDTAQVIFQYQV
jgi:hypothetical protein